MKSTTLTQKIERAFAAPVIRRLFSSSPRDPRYHMLSYISSKFSQEPKTHIHEPRAAWFLNRFTRTLTVMFATNGLDAILGVSAEQLKGKSFYYCIAESCLPDAIRCMEGAKANDSIAYLRFWFRNPVQEEARNEHANIEDARSSDEDEDEGGVQLNTQNRPSEQDPNSHSAAVTSTSAEEASSGQEANDPNAYRMSRASSGNSTDVENTGNEPFFDGPPHAQSSTSSIALNAAPEPEDRQMTPRARPTQRTPPVEVEAVVSATSDGLVVILRRALPIIPQTLQRPAATPAPPPAYNTGFFASPWAPEPINPPPFAQQPQYDWNVNYSAPAMPQQPAQVPTPPTTAQGLDFMSTIREVAVFAWALTGINGSLSQYTRGSPEGEAQPPGGMPIWDPSSNADPENIYNGFADNSNRRVYNSDPNSSGSGSDNEVVWRRAPEIPPWRPVERSGSDDSSKRGGSSEEDEKALKRMRLT
jgi:hypothetical protein